MATDNFLKMMEIKGESSDSQHKDEIELLSWSWGMSQSGGGLATGAGVGKVNIGDISFMHTFDKASPNLMSFCASGRHIKEATLTVRRAGDTPQEFLIIKMTDVIVTSVQVSESDESPIESFSMEFGKVDVNYMPQKADGSLDAGIHFKYDIKASKSA